MKKERTTDLTKLEQGHPFTWGELVKIHRFFEYTIVEYHPHIYNKGICTFKIDHEASEFLIYIDGKDRSRSYDTYDSAIVGCIAQKYEGYNAHADQYFMKMIKQ